MNIEDIEDARAEAKKFLDYVDEFCEVFRGDSGEHPAERGLVKAQSIILSRALAAMRNPYSCPRSTISKKIRSKK